MGVVLRLTQAATGDGQHVVTTRLTGLPGYPEASATSRFELSITDDDRERIRWYQRPFGTYRATPSATRDPGKPSCRPNARTPGASGGGRRAELT